MTSPDYTPMLYWVREREAIRLKKESGALRPWTNDRFLHEWRFCNVRREDDPVTVWIRRNIRERFAGHPLLWLMLCAARQINWPPTLWELIVNQAFPGLHDSWDERMAMQMHARGSRKEKVYTGAYTITAPKAKGANKIDFTVFTVIGQLYRERDQFAALLASKPTVRKFCERLMRFDAWGGTGFMAYQVAGDMLFTPLLANAEDRDIFMIAGPGTCRGLNRLYGRPVDARISQEQMRSELRKLLKTVPEETGIHIAVNDAGNICCEFDKYMRLKNGEGEPRQRYEPAIEPWQDLPELLAA